MTNKDEEIAKVLMMRNDFIEFYKIGFLDGYRKGKRPKKVNDKQLWKEIRKTYIASAEERFKQPFTKEMKKALK